MSYSQLYVELPTHVQIGTHALLNPCRFQRATVIDRRSMLLLCIIKQQYSSPETSIGCFLAACNLSEMAWNSRLLATARVRSAYFWESRPICLPPPFSEGDEGSLELYSTDALRVTRHEAMV